MDAESIPCVLISGTAQNSEGTTENHEWNYVQLDGKWYAIDVTWDDPIIQGGGYLTNSLKYKYFLKGLNTINKNHFLNGKVSVNGITFTYPNLEKNDY
jgi:transglutaminase/protease-like cytokinesis protein 3